MKAVMRHVALIAWCQFVGVIIVIMSFLAYRAWFDPVGATSIIEWVSCIFGGMTLGAVAYLLRTRKQRRVARNIAAAQRLHPPPNPRDDYVKRRESQPTQSFDARLEKYVRHAAPTRQRVDDDFRSNMPFWSAEDWFFKRAPKSFAYIRAVLRRIRACLQSPNADRTGHKTHSPSS